MTTEFEGSDTTPVPVPASPRFDDHGLNPSVCDLATAARVSEAIELCFGHVESRSPGSPGLVGAVLTHRIRLDPEAAQHLEEVLSRVLGLPEMVQGTGART